MLIEGDVSGLEVVTAAYLSQDTVLMKEIRDNEDIHANNQQRFKLPDRRIAKIFKFRLIYGGSKWSYALDTDFNWISDSAEYWQSIIEEYYRKYFGLARWHETIVNEVARNGKLVMPTGRVYEYTPYFKNNQWVWPRTKILNYPVQGLGADLVAIARASAFKRLGHLPGVYFIMTVHDSILLDVDNSPELVYNVCQTLEQVFVDIPKNFEKLFGVEFNLPMKGEVKYGPNWGAMKEMGDE